MSSSVSIPMTGGGGISFLQFSMASHGLFVSPTVYYLSPGPHCANAGSTTIERRAPYLGSTKSVVRVRFRARIPTTGSGPATATYSLMKAGSIVAATSIPITIQNSVTAQTAAIAGVSIADLDDLSCVLVMTGSNIANSGADIVLTYELG